MEFDFRKLDEKIGGDEALAKEFFLNLRSAHALEEMETALLNLKESKYVRFFFKEKNLCVESNIFMDNRLSLVRGQSADAELVETEFGLLSCSNETFNLRLKDVKNSARIYKEKTLVAQTSKGDVQMNLEKGCYFLELDGRWYVLDLSLENQ